jgi:hypothetical protein
MLAGSWSIPIVLAALAFLMSVAYRGFRVILFAIIGQVFRSDIMANRRS